MAMSVEQKRVNKEASLVKKAAHYARSCELHKATEAADAIVRNGAIARKYEAARCAEDVAIKSRNDALTEVQSQITALQARVDVIRSGRAPEIEKLNVLKREAANAFYAELARCVAEAEGKFPDMPNMYARSSSVVWIPPVGYVEKFAIDNAEGLAKKKANRDKKAK